MSSKVSQAVSSPLTNESTATGKTTLSIPRPQHFIKRNDGSITPLIAVDELPESIRIVGVPAVISQATTLNMVDLGVQARSQSKYIVELPEDSGSGNTGNLSQVSATTESIFHSQEKRCKPPKNITVEEKTASEVNDVEQWRLSVKTVEKSVDETQVPQYPVQKGSGDTTSIRLLTLPKAAIDAVVAANAKSRAVNSAPSPKALTPGVFGEKKYCTHWIRWGECDYMQQGCKYKHEMPDEETLMSIGIRTVPKWYRNPDSPKNAWVERPPPSERVRREPHSRAVQPISPYRLSYASGGEVFRSPYISSEEPFLPPYQSSAELYRPYTQPPRSISGPRPAFGNGFAPRAGPFALGSNGQIRTIGHQYTPPPPKFLISKNKIGGSNYRFPAASSSAYRNTSISTRRLVPASVISPASTATVPPPAPAPASVPVPASARTGGAPPSPFSPPLTTQPLSPARVLPTTTSLAPIHRSLLPFLGPLEPSLALPPTPVPEIKTPAPRHRRLFVAAGESPYVENGGSDNNKKAGDGTGDDGAKWKELGEGIEELLVDFEE